MKFEIKQINLPNDFKPTHHDNVLNIDVVIKRHRGYYWDAKHENGYVERIALPEIKKRFTKILKDESQPLEG